jgi:hypothetical protein
METCNTLIPVPFRNTTLFLVDIDGTPYTPMKPIVEGMGLSWSGQFEKLNENKDRFCIRVSRIQMDGDDQTRDVVLMPLRKLPGWLMTIHPTRVNPAIRETVIAYQNECDDALWDYWTQGQAINPRSTSIQSDAYTLPYQPTLEIQVLESVIRELRVSETSKIRMYAAFCKSNNINSDFLPEYVNEPLVRAITPLLKEMGSDLSSKVARTVNPALEAMGILVHLSRNSKSKGIKKFWSLTEEGLKYGRNETSPSDPRETQPLFFVDRFPELLARLEAYLDEQKRRLI